MLKYNLFFFFLISIIISSCKKEATQTEIIQSSKEYKPIEITRIERSLFEAKSPEDVAKILQEQKDFSEAIFRLSEIPKKNIIYDQLYNLAINPSLDTVYNNSNQYYGDMMDIRLQFAEAFERLKIMYPSFKAPKIKTIVSGFVTDLFVSDSLIVIGLDFFMGENCKYKPQLPNYILSRYRREYIVPMCMTLLTQKYMAYDPKENSLLAEMIYYGKSAFMIQQLLPNINDTIITGFSKLELDDVNEHEDIIWGHFVEKKLFFETNHTIITKYTGERPNTTEIGNKCPGRIGRWLGWKIVNKYVEKSDLKSITELFANKSSQKIFDKANYKPNKK